MRKALYILGDLEDRDLLWLSANGDIQTAATGTTLIQAGEPLRHLFFITEGALRVSAPGGRTLATLGVGDIAGEMSFVEKSSPSVSVIVTSDCRFLSVPRATLLTAFTFDHAFAARFYRALAVFLSDRLRTAQQSDLVDDVDNELDEGLLDNLHVAGDRLLRLIDLLEGRARA